MGKKAGRPAGPLLERFAHMGKRNQPSVYLLALSNNVIKVGYSRSPAFRLADLAREFERQSIFIDRFCSYPGSRNFERACIAGLTAVAQPLPGRLEYFTGINYDDAKAVIETASA